MNQTFKYKLALLRQTQNFIFFAKNVLQDVVKRPPLMPNSKKHTNDPVLAKTKLLCKIKIVFVRKIFFKDLLPKLVLFFEYFFMNQTFKYKIALLRQAKTFICFWKNVLQGVVKRVPLMPNSKKLTNGAVLAKRKILCKIKFCCWGKFSLRICSKNWCCFLNIFSWAKLSNTKWHFWDRLKPLFFFEKMFFNVLWGASCPCQTPKSLPTVQFLQKENYFVK